MQKYGWDTKEHAIIKRLDGVMYPDWIIGDYYFVTEVDAILTNFRDAIRKYQNLIEDQDEQIVTLKSERDNLKLYHDSTHGYQSAREKIINRLEDDNARQAEQITTLKETVTNILHPEPLGKEFQAVLNTVPYEQEEVKG